MIVFDTETTGLILSSEANLKNQPKIIELYALKIEDSTLEKQDEMHLLIDPGEPLSEEIIRITSISDEMVKGKGLFSSHLRAVSEFWLGERFVCGHNVTFDLDMLEIELRRLGAVTRFPWTPKRICTVEASEHLEGRRLKLTDLHIKLFGEPFASAHRAKADVEATYRCLKELASRGDVAELI